MKIFYCFSAQLAGYLVEHGLWIISTKANNKNPRFKVFLFEDSENLRSLVNDYSKSKRENH